MSSFSVFDIAGQAMSAQNIRLNAIASNMANAETVGSSPADTYKAKHPIFASVKLQIEGESGDDVGLANGVKVDDIAHSSTPVEMKYDPSHPKADENGYIYLSNVNMVQEMADMISASRSFQMNAQLLSSAKELMHNTLNLGR